MLTMSQNGDITKLGESSVLQAQTALISGADDDDFVGFRSLFALGIYGMDH